MSIKEKIENNAAIFFMGAMVVGFISGFGAFTIILDLSNREIVQQDSYVLKEKFSNYLVEWDIVKKQYVLRPTKEVLIEAPSPDNITRLERTEAQIRHLTRLQYKILRSRRLDEFIRIETPIVIEKVLKDSSFELYSEKEPKTISSLLILLGREILPKHNNKREELLNTINSEEKDALEKLKVSGSNWLPASYENIAKLNLQERQLELVSTQLDISRIQVREFIHKEWIPLSLEKFSKDPFFLDYFKKAQDDMERLDILTVVFIEIFALADEKYDSLMSPIDEQQAKIMKFIESQFGEISGEDSVSEIDRDIEHELIGILENLDKSLEKEMEMLQKEMKMLNSAQ